MKKNLKKLGLILTIATSLVFTTGCDKKSEKKIAEDMVEKYSSYCTLGDYKSLTYVETKTEITQDDVQYQVNSLLDAYATSTEVTSGVAEFGDTVNIDYLGKVDGVEFEGGSSNGAGCELTLGSGRMIDGFEEQIVGHSVGETFDIYVTFPENYGATELAGVDAVFTITINTKLEKVYPEYTDEFVAANTEYKTIAEFEEYLMTAMTENSAKSDLEYNKTAVVTAAIEATTINEYPQKEMQKLIDSTIADEEAKARSAGYELSDYVVGYYGMTMEQFESYLNNEVKNFMKEKIVICAIAEKESITVTEKEVSDFRKEMMSVLGYTDEKEFAEYYTEEDVVYYALADKVVDFLLENATPVEATSTDAVQ